MLDCLELQESKESLGTGYVSHMADCKVFLMGLFGDPPILMSLIPENTDQPFKDAQCKPYFEWYLCLDQR